MFYSSVETNFLLHNCIIYRPSPLYFRDGVLHQDKAARSSMTLEGPEAGFFKISKCTSAFIALAGLGKLIIGT